MKEFIMQEIEERTTFGSARKRYESVWKRYKPVAELVRCQNCKNGEPGACGYGIDCDGVWHDDDWYCADGKMWDDNA